MRVTSSNGIMSSNCCKSLGGMWPRLHAWQSEIVRISTRFYRDTASSRRITWNIRVSCPAVREREPQSGTLERCNSLSPCGRGLGGDACLRGGGKAAQRHDTCLPHPHPSPLPSREREYK